MHSVDPKVRVTTGCRVSHKIQNMLTNTTERTDKNILENIIKISDHFKVYAYFKRQVFYLFICSLFNVEWKGDRWIVNWKGCGRKWSLLNLRHFWNLPGGTLRKTTKPLFQDSRSPCRDVNLRPPAYEAQQLLKYVLTWRQWHLLLNDAVLSSGEKRLYKWRYPVLWQTI
jgi:hypothetical protein